MSVSPVSAGSAPKLTRLARDGRPASASPDDEQAARLAIAGLVQDEEGYPLANIKVLAEPIRPRDANKLTEDEALEATRSVLTGFDGAFYFGALTDDEYRIHAAPTDGFAPAEIKARVGEVTANLVLVSMREVRVFGSREQH